MNNTTNETGRCSPYDTEEYVAVSILSASIGFVSFIACFIVIGIIILFKKYLFFNQRLVLYLSIAAMINSFATMFRMHRIAYDSETTLIKVLCIINGSLDQITSWAQLLAVCCITFSVFTTVVLNRDPEKVEWVYALMIFILPLTYNWIPFLKSTYGQAGAWCWIRNENPRDCSHFEFGSYLQFILWYIPLYILLLLLVVIYFIIICKIRSLNHQWQLRKNQNTREQQQSMIAEICPLLWYPLFYIILNIPALVNRVYGAFSSDPLLPLWVLHAIFGSLEGGFVSLAYALDSETLRRCDCRCILGALGPSKDVKEYPANPALSDSLARGGSRTTSETSQYSKYSYPTDV